jgi:hypothetical protein
MATETGEARGGRLTRNDMAESHVLFFALAAPWQGIALVSVARASLPVLQKHGGTDNDRLCEH